MYSEIARRYRGVPRRWEGKRLVLENTKSWQTTLLTFALVETKRRANVRTKRKGSSLSLVHLLTELSPSYFIFLTPHYFLSASSIVCAFRTSRHRSCCCNQLSLTLSPVCLLPKPCSLRFFPIFLFPLLYFSPPQHENARTRLIFNGHQKSTEKNSKLK